MLVEHPISNLPIAIAPFFIRNGKSSYFGMLKTLQFLGTNLVCSDHLNIIIRTKYRDQATDLITKYISTNRQHFHYIRLSELHEQSITMALLKQRLMSYGFTFRNTKQNICPYLRIHPTWEQTQSHLSKRFKKNLKYYPRRLEKDYQFEITPFDMHANIEFQINEFKRLHQTRWSVNGKQGLFSNPNYESFHKRIITTCAQNGWLRLYFLRLKQKNVAAIYAYSYANKYYYYQAGFDTEYKKYSLGQILLNYLIRKAFDEGATEFDFLRGVTPYKYQWTDQHRINNTHIIGKKDLIDFSLSILSNYRQPAKKNIKRILPNVLYNKLRQLLIHK